MTKVLLLGSCGQLGTALIHTAPKEIELITKNKEDLDITNFKLIESQIKNIKPDILINCAAYTKVDKAENDKNNSFLVNADAVKCLAELSNEYNYFIINFSTDYVYDGIKKKPYKENDKKKPNSIYGLSKNLGDNQIKNYAKKYIIFRVSWLFGPDKINFLTTMLDLFYRKKNINVIDDQYSIPTFSYDLSEYIWKIINENNINTLKSDVYNFSNKGDIISWYDFANKINDIAKNYFSYNIEINRISTKELNQKAKRPMFSVLDCSKVDNNFKYQRFNWIKSIDKSLQIIKRRK